jgi:hypothetical protein
MRLKSDFLEVLLAATSEGLDQLNMEWDRRVALGVVMAAAGYPLNPRKGDAITGLDRVTQETHPDVQVFHAGTATRDGSIAVNGGRVLLETHCLDWPAHLGTEGGYGKLVRVELLHKLHDELKYESMDALNRGIQRDCDDARAWLAARI